MAKAGPSKFQFRQSPLKLFSLKALFSLEGLPFFLSLSLLTFLIILFRMKNIEQTYQYNELNKNIERSLLVNKEIKANKAKLLSIKNLQEMARKFHLQQPRPEQIIIIP